MRRKDPTDFRNRVKAWSSGTPISELYENGVPKELPKYDGGDSPDDYTYYGKRLPDVTIETPKVNPYVYYDGFGGAATIDSNGRRVLHDARTFNPEGFIPLKSAADYENARLLLHKTTDPNHAYQFGNTIRNLALATTVAPMAGPLLNATAAAGDAAYAGYKALPWLTQQLIGKGTQAAFAADGLYNFFGPEGTKKTTRLINEGKYGDAALSAAGDIFNLSMAAPVLEAGQALVKAAKPVADKTISFLNSPLTGKWTTIGNRQYRLSPNSLGANGVPVESRTSQIIPENAANMTPEQWTAAQDAAIAKGDMVEAQRLRDLRASIKGKYKIGYKGQPPHLNNPYYDGVREFDELATGNFNSSSENVAATYAKDIHTDKEGLLLKNYIFSDKPYVIDAKGRSYEEVVDELSTDEIVDRVIKLGKNDGVIIKNVDDALLSLKGKPLKKKLRIADDIVGFPGRTKLADAVTYDDNGVRIPLGERDNFNVNDIRWGVGSIKKKLDPEDLYKNDFMSATEIGQMLRRLQYERLLSGDLSVLDEPYNLISSSDIPVIKRVPELTKEILRNSTLPRIKDQRPWMSQEELDREFERWINTEYSEVTEPALKKAYPDAPENVLGMYSTTNDNIKVVKGKNANDVLVHEVRHRLDNKIPTTESEDLFLENAYGDDFVNLPNYYEDLNGYTGMRDEMITTNADARKVLLGNYKAAKVPPHLQNQIIDKVTDEQILDALENANGYGRNFVHYLVTKHKDTPERMKAIREAMKHVGGYALPTLLAGYTMNNKKKKINKPK